jgi:hypothetical protein
VNGTEQLLVKSVHLIRCTRLATIPILQNLSPGFFEVQVFYNMDISPLYCSDIDYRCNCMEIFR